MAEVKQMIVRSITAEDIEFWYGQGEVVTKVDMRGDHIGAENIQVLRCFRNLGDNFPLCWRIPFVIPEGDGTTYWFTMFSREFPAVAAVMQAPQQ